MSAIDLNTRQLMWQVPMGSARIPVRWAENPHAYPAGYADAGRPDLDRFRADLLCRDPG
jgi:hypothetical protein